MDGLYHEMALHGISLLQERLVESTIGVSGDEAAIALCHAYLEFAYANRGLYQVINRKNTDDQSKSMIRNMKALV
jgi:hypothetical protein